MRKLKKVKKNTRRIIEKVGKLTQTFKTTGELDHKGVKDLFKLMTVCVKNKNPSYIFKDPVHYYLLYERIKLHIHRPEDFFLGELFHLCDRFGSARLLYLKHLYRVIKNLK